NSSILTLTTSPLLPDTPPFRSSASHSGRTLTASGYAGARRHPRLGALCVAFATFGFARASAAEPDIERDAPAECPSAEDARRAVARLIEPSRVSQLRLMFRARRAGSVWIAELRTPGGDADVARRDLSRSRRCGRGDLGARGGGKPSGAPGDS